MNTTGILRGKIIFKILKYFLVVVSFIYIYFCITTNDSYLLFKTNFLRLSTENGLFYFLVAVLLMPVNWGIEAIKWKMLIRPVEEINFSTSMKAAISGVSTGIFTPNRIGEFGGRLIFLKTSHKGSAFFATLAGSFSQFTATVLFGAFGLIYILKFHSSIESWIYFTICFITFIAIVFNLILYFNFSKISEYTSQNSLLKKVFSRMKILTQYDFVSLNKILFLSSLRYIIFTFQYIFLLYAFGIGINILDAYCCISLIFLIQTAFPTISLMELGIRGAGAVGIIGLYSADKTGILLSAFSLYIINIIIPAIVGLGLITGLKISGE